MYSSTDLKVAKLHERHPTSEPTASPSTRTRPATMTSPVLYPVEVAEEDLLRPDTPAARRRAYCPTPTKTVQLQSWESHEYGGETTWEGERAVERGGGLRLWCVLLPHLPTIYRGQGGGGAAAKGEGRRPRWASPPQTLTPPPREGGRLPHGPLWGPFRWAAPIKSNLIFLLNINN